MVLIECVYYHSLYMFDKIKPFLENEGVTVTYWSPNLIDFEINDFYISVGFPYAPLSYTVINLYGYNETTEFDLYFNGFEEDFETVIRYIQELPSQEGHNNKK